MNKKKAPQKPVFTGTFAVTPRLRNYGGKRGPMIRIPRQAYDKLKSISALSGATMAEIVACAIEGIAVPK